MRASGHGKHLSICKMIAGIGVLCLATGAIAENPTQPVGSVSFTETPVPASVEEQTQVFTTSVATVRYRDGREMTFPLHYETLFLSGDRKGRGRAGEILDVSGRTLPVSAPGADGGRGVGPFYAYAPDANSLIQVSNKRGDRIYLVTQYEYHTEAPVNQRGAVTDMYARLPMAVSLASLKQNAGNGRMAVTQLRNVDVRDVKGIWIPCAGSLTPWNTHVGGEEYEPNARYFEHEPLEAMNLYLRTPGKLAVEGGANPYDYGHPFEISVSSEGKTTVKKLLALGRLSYELVEIMPDERTVYMEDDGRDTMLFMFVADRPRDLSEGTLYAARWEQRYANDGGQADLRWIRLGHASDHLIERIIRAGMTYSNIFDTVSQAEYQTDPERYAEFKPVYVYEGQGGVRPGVSRPANEAIYLRVKPGMEIAAAFLESRKYGALLGATSEFTKMEGVTHNAADKNLYVALSMIEAGMLSRKNGQRPQDHISLVGETADFNCGGVYRSNLRSGQKDGEGNPIDSEWVAADMVGYLMGRKKPEGQMVGSYDRCDSERIANPDNLKYSPAMRTLFIGEDSSNHLNNFLWAHNVDSKATVRILSAPVGGELTGLQVVPNVNGFAYVMSNVQHPGAANDLKSYPAAIRETLRRQVDQRGRVGYIGGLPALD